MKRNRAKSRWMPAVLLSLLPLIAAARSIDPLPSSRIWVGGTSSMRGWECKATEFQLKVDSDAGAAAAILGGSKAVTGAALTIPTDKLECGNGTMNGHAKKALKIDEHPTIEFRLLGYELSKAGDSVNVTMKGTLMLGGTEKEIEMAAIASPAEDGVLRIAATWQFKMTDFGLKPPTMMFGRMKVHDQVTVGFDVLLKDNTN